MLQLHHVSGYTEWLNFHLRRSGANEVTEEKQQKEEGDCDLIWLAPGRSTPRLEPRKCT